MKTICSLALCASLCIAAFATPVLANDSPIVRGSLQVTEYDGISDDLLSAGLNLAGLQSAVAPGFVDPLNPTPAELRRRAIYNNYRGIVDPVAAGGMGLLWGPGAPGAPAFDPPVQAGLIPGVEYRAYLHFPARRPHVNNVPAAVQIPRHFDPAKPCIVAAMPSGSRSVYGGIAIAEWALFKGCAVALPGKGTDTGFHLLDPSAAAYAVDGPDGVSGSVAALGDDAQFALRDTRRLEEYVARNPHRIATKHAHSQANPERSWGEYGLRGIEFAFWALNDHFGARDGKHGRKHFDRRNTLVIAAGTSNGGGMALRALEADHKGLIDAVVVTEPNIQPRDGRYAIRVGDEPPFDPAGRSLYDSITLMSVYAACAAHAPGAAGTVLFGPQALGVARCTSLREKGLVSGDTLAEQAASALQVIRAHGYAAAQDWGIASHDTLNLWRALQVTYANAYGRFAVEENVCGVSLAATDAAGAPAALSEANAKKLFADSSGVPPTGGINLIADRAATGPILENAAVSASTGRADLNIDSALCFRALETGERIADGKGWGDFAAVQRGTREVKASGKLHGRPAIVIHGRRDALVFPNLHSRAYYALNQQEERGRSRLSYIEVTTGQHFDAFISFFFNAGGVQFAPLHHYFVLAMDSMYAHLTTGAPLPPSQVVRPTPRATAPYTPANVPALLPAPVLAPAAGDRITFADGVLSIPE
ncbi:MAG: D-(-)-3-hydroxybutyrate oligomer hydrolase [Betaproteobacteria bacterium]|nr:D-(-)-3-hydroxybutyrate oligomer hydrolase [Betaproteobacteria bacterium]MDH4322766.1 D-(-)-3-hydroxybutyrate oligomer hydrolase [Betaproteobacteria bacterium]